MKKMSKKLENYLLNERWQTIYIDNKATRYEVSCYGYVRNSETNRVISQHKSSNGYYTVQLHLPDKSHRRFVHILVAEYFLDNPGMLPCVRHRNGNIEQNDSKNLEWAVSTHETGDIGIIFKKVVFNGVQTDYIIFNNGILISPKTNQPMRPAPNSSGYPQTVIVVNNKRHTVGIHRLVAEAFIPNPNNLPEVNHKDGNKLNCWDWNLEWMTHQENVIHAIDNKLREDFPTHRISSKEVHIICKLLEEGQSLSYISELTNIPKPTIRNIKNGLRWTRVSENYKIPS